MNYRHLILAPAFVAALALAGNAAAKDTGNPEDANKTISISQKDNGDPTYRINGGEARTIDKLSDDELVEIKAELKKSLKEIKKDKKEIRKDLKDETKPSIAAEALTTAAKSLEEAEDSMVKTIKTVEAEQKRRAQRKH